MKQYRFTVTPTTQQQLKLLIRDRHADINDLDIGRLMPGAKFFPAWGSSCAPGHMMSSAPVREHGAHLLWERLIELGFAPYQIGYHEVPWDYKIDSIPAAAIEDAAFELPHARREARAAMYVDPEPKRHGFRPWQKTFLSWALESGREHAAHVPGAGKTLSGIFFLLFALRRALRGPVGSVGMPKGCLPTLIFTSTLNPTFQIRDEWQWLTTLSPFVYRAPSKQRQKHLKIGDYLHRCREEGEPAVLILGREHLPMLCFPGESGKDGDPTFFEALRAAKCCAVGAVVDEIHRLKSHSRWEKLPGDRNFELKGNQAAAIWWLLNKGATFGANLGAKEREVFFRIALSATPVDNRTIDYWAELDLIDPYSFGSYYDFGTRYCDGGPGQYTLFEAKGSSNTPELTERLGQVRHIALSDEVSALLPPFTERVKRVSQASQNKVKGGYKTAAKAIRNADKGADEAQEQAVMFLTAMAAQAKRPVVVDDIVEELRAGRKVLCFTGFAEDVGEIRSQVCQRLGLKRIKELDHKQHGIEDDIFIGSTHGDQHNAEQRNILVRAYNERDGASLLVGTGDSIGESYNIENTDIVIFAQLPITPGKRIQWRGRVKDRQRRRRASTAVYYVAEGTYDTRLVDILFPKEKALVELGLVTAADASFADALRGSEPERASKAAAYIQAFLNGADLGAYEDDSDE